MHIWQPRLTDQTGREKESTNPQHTQHNTRNHTQHLKGTWSSWAPVTTRPFTSPIPASSHPCTNLFKITLLRLWAWLNTKVNLHGKHAHPKTCDKRPLNWRQFRQKILLPWLTWIAPAGIQLRAPAPLPHLESVANSL